MNRSHRSGLMNLLIKVVSFCNFQLIISKVIYIDRYFENACVVDSIFCDTAEKGAVCSCICTRFCDLDEPLTNQIGANVGSLTGHGIALGG